MSTTRKILVLTLGGVVALSAVSTTFAQASFTVTALSGKNAAWTEIAGERAPLTSGGPLMAGRAGVNDGQQMMLSGEYEIESGDVVNAVIVILGPAEFELGTDEEFGFPFVRLQQGRMVLARSMGPEDEDYEYESVRLQIGWNADDEEAAISAPLYPGRTFAAHVGDDMSMVFLAESQMPQESLVLTPEDEIDLSSSQMLRVVDDTADILEADAAQAWMKQRRLDVSWVGELSSSEAQVLRARLENQLFENIIEWDRFAGKDYVQARLGAERFEPEIRQVVISAQAPVSKTSPAGASRGVQGVPAANEVPPLSPAALSVQNIAAGVTAIQLNRDARNLLTVTGSQGLGFGGLSQLAIPGFNNGIRTIGPAGLGAQRN